MIVDSFAPGDVANTGFGIALRRSLAGLDDRGR
jgi:hypothetical protein